MEIIVNGEIHQSSEAISAQQLIEKLELVGQRLALEVNEEIVPKSTFSTYYFQDGDKVEIVHAIGGG